VRQQGSSYPVPLVRESLSEPPCPAKRSNWVQIVTGNRLGGKSLWQPDARAAQAMGTQSESKNRCICIFSAGFKLWYLWRMAVASPLCRMIAASVPGELPSCMSP